MGRRFLGLVLTLSLLSAFVPFVCTAADAATSGDCGDNVTWVLDGDTLIISGTGAMTDYSNSDTSPWYGNKTSIASVVIKTGVTTIGSYAFYGCNNLMDITIPDGITNIGDSAFSKCTGLTEVHYDDTFDNFVKITVGSDNTAFTDAKIQCEDITVDKWGTCGDNLIWTLDNENTLTISGTGAMTDYSAYDSAPWYDSCLGIAKVVIKAGVTTIGSYAFYGCENLTDITIPDGLISIGDSAFSGCESLTDVTIPDSVTNIGRYAFHYCAKLTNIAIPAGVTSISEGMFFGCEKLTGITIPAGVTHIGDSAFSGCVSLASVTIPKSVKNIGDNAFYECTGLTEVHYSGIFDDFAKISVGSDNTVFTDAIIQCTDITVNKWGVCGDNLIWTLDDNGTLTIIGEGDMVDFSTAPWYDSRLSITSVVIKTDVTTIGSYAFYGCENLTSVTIPDGITNIGDSAFSGCASLTEVTIPDSVTNIGRYAFHYCAELTNIVIPAGVTSISEGMFFGCEKLTGITIPDSVTHIGDSVFADCYGLRDMYISDMSAYLHIAFGNDTSYPMYYACKLYLNDNLVTSVEISDDITQIPDYAFRGCNDLTSVTIPDSVINIGEHAFSGCSGLMSVTIGNGITNIGDYAFSDCAGLTDVYYNGYEVDWNNITIGNNNECLTGAEIHCNSSTTPTPTPTTQPTDEPTPTPISVPTPLPITTAEITKSETDTTYNFDVSPKAAYANCYVYATVYDDNGVLLAVSRVPLETEENTSISVNKSANDALVKVFIWADTQQPIIDAATEFPLK